MRFIRAVGSPVEDIMKNSGMVSPGFLLALIILGIISYYIFFTADSYAKILILFLPIPIVFIAQAIRGLKSGTVTMYSRSGLQQAASREGGLRMKFNYWGGIAIYLFMAAAELWLLFIVRQAWAPVPLKLHIESPKAGRQHFQRGYPVP